MGKGGSGWAAVSVAVPVLDRGQTGGPAEKQAPVQDEGEISPLERLKDDEDTR